MILKHALLTSAGLLALTGAISLAAIPALAQSGGTESPQGEDAIYLEADQLIDQQENGVLIARGDVQARYGQRTLRADEVVYNTRTGIVTATGNVVIIDENGGSQYSDKVELNNRLESAGAGNFVARFPEGGIASAAYAVRRSDEGIDLYNAYYTACEPCEDSEKPPTWRLRARRVTQDKEDQMIHYRDATFEFMGIPVFYTPYLAHPDPESERRSGLLFPFAGRSGAYGLFYEQPYYVAISPYSELTLTPRVMERVTPLMFGEYNKKFNKGTLSLEGSFTYGEWFDNRGNGFSDADRFLNPGRTTATSRLLDLSGDRWRSHLFAKGEFDLTENWGWGFTAQTATDPFYLDRYDIEEPNLYNGLVDGGGRRLVQQIYAVGQDENWRYSAQSYGFQSLRGVARRGRTIEDPNNAGEFITVDEDLITAVVENDSGLPVILPKIDLDHYFDLGGMGRVHAFGDAVALSRASGDDYSRASVGARWQRQFYTSGGVSVRPFAMARADLFDLEAADLNDTTLESRSFSRAIGHVGLDTRWTLINPQNGVDWVIEPRVQITQSFGDSKNAEFFVTEQMVTRDLYEDGAGLDLDRALLFSPNKATGFDLWQDGFRADIGASFGAHWLDNRAEVFIGQSYASGYDEVYSAVSGLSGDSSDIVTEGTLMLGNRFVTNTRLRFDDDGGDLRRADSSVRYTGDRFRASLRYFKIDGVAASNTPLFSNLSPDEELSVINSDFPPEEISGSVAFDVTENWGIRYRANRDIDRELMRRQEFALIFDDDCTLIEIFYERNRNNLGLAGNNEGVGIRISLKTLGDFRPE